MCDWVGFGFARQHSKTRRSGKGVHFNNSLKVFWWHWPEYHSLHHTSWYCKPIVWPVRGEARLHSRNRSASGDWRLNSFGVRCPGIAFTCNRRRASGNGYSRNHLGSQVKAARARHPGAFGPPTCSSSSGFQEFCCLQLPPQFKTENPSPGYRKR